MHEFDLWHTINREIMHIFWGPGVYLACLIGFLSLEKHWKSFPRLKGWWQLIVPAVPFMFIVFAREAFDVYNGGALLKSIIDWSTWAGIVIVCIVGTRAITPVLVGICREVGDSWKKLGFKPDA